MTCEECLRIRQTVPYNESTAEQRHAIYDHISGCRQCFSGMIEMNQKSGYTPTRDEQFVGDMDKSTMTEEQREQYEANLRKIGAIK